MTTRLRYLRGGIYVRVYPPPPRGGGVPGSGALHIEGIHKSCTPPPPPRSGGGYLSRINGRIFSLHGGQYDLLRSRRRTFLFRTRFSRVIFHPSVCDNILLLTVSLSLSGESGFSQTKCIQNYIKIGNNTAQIPCFSQLRGSK